MVEPAASFDLGECVACGLCLEVCPTYLIRRDEGSGPRGRLRLMDLLASGDMAQGGWTAYLDECVGCLACQALCPASVPYASMLDQAHADLTLADKSGAVSGRLTDWFLEKLLPYPRRLARLRLPLRLARRLGLLFLVGRLRMERWPGLGWLTGARWLPRRIRGGPRPPGPSFQAAWAFFPGCVGGLLFPAEERATRRILSHLGGYSLATQSVCCGAVHRHLGRLDKSRELARRNIAAYEELEGFIVTVAAGCGAALKDYGHWLADDPDWAARARRFSARVRDLNEILARALSEQRFDFNGGTKALRRAAYDDPCHALHAQGIEEAPRALLDALPDIEQVELPHADRCCGAGGTYFMRQPELSREMIAGRLKDLASVEVSLLLTSNPGCRIQWEAALAKAGWDVEVRHPAELWAEALADGSITIKESARNPL